MITTTRKLMVQSAAFSNNGHIPLKYTCEGDDISPALEIGDVPGDTKTLAIIMEDPDAPHGVFTHWIAWNMPVTEVIAEKTNEGISGMNDFGKTGYGGPCPPSGTHRYYFRIYALDTELSVSAGENKQSLLESMEGHVIAVGELMGRYRKGTARSSS